MGKIISGVLTVLLLWAMRFGCNMIGLEVADDSEWIAEENAWIAEEIAEGQAEPARAWVNSEKRATYEASLDEVKGLVEQFHAAGAEGVWMAGLEEWEGVQYAGYIAVKLPAEGATRDGLFAVEAAYWEGSGTDDVGQEYLVIPLD